MTLAKTAEQISVGEVFRHIEGGLPLAECFADADNTCPLTSACRLKVALSAAAQAFYASLDKITLDSLICDNLDLMEILQPVSCGRSAIPAP
jgi:Rrf2 family nitric oxide-sensitive transcriptional repressor